MASDALTSEKLRQKLQDVEQELRETKQKLQKADKKARGLSWSEALSLWHTIFANPRIRPRYQTIRANHFTTAKGRRHPKQLRHWNSFHRLHKSAFTLICNQLAKTEAKHLNHASFIRLMRKGLCQTVYWIMKLRLLPTNNGLSKSWSLARGSEREATALDWIQEPPGPFLG